jgi:hypothetical protein
MTHPPSGPSTPPPPPGPRIAGDLDTAELLLRSLQVLAADRLAGADPALRMQFTYGLRTARRAVAALQAPARRDPSSAAVGADAIATPGGPVTTSRLVPGERPSPGLAVAHGGARGSAGSPPAPGADFKLPRDVRLEIGTGPVYDALPRRHNP